MHKIKLASLALVGIAALAACGGTPSNGAQPAPTTAPTTAVGSPAPSASEISREDAAEQYLRLVKRSNKLTRKCNEREVYFENNPTATSFAKIKDCMRDLAASLRTLAEDLRDATWPAEVRGDIEKLARYSEAFAYALEQMAEAETFQDYWDVAVPEDDGSADIVRARLGLETRS